MSAPTPPAPEAGSLLTGRAESDERAADVADFADIDPEADTDDEYESL